MSYPDLFDQECSICGSYHTRFICIDCCKRQKEELLQEFEKILDRKKWILNEPRRGDTTRYTENHLTSLHNNSIEELKQELQKLRGEIKNV